MSQNKVDIVCVTDNNYAQHLGVMLCSLFETNKELIFSINIVDAGVSKENIRNFEEIAKTYNQNLAFIEIDKHIFDSFSIRNHITRAAYYKVLLPDLFPEINKVLALDCDIVVSGSISELWNTEFGENYVVAVENPGFNRFKQLGIPIGSITFNSGVMLMNLEKLRKDNIPMKIFNYLRNNSGSLTLHDQDGYNAIIYNKWKKVDPKWNVQTKFLEVKSTDTTYDQIEISQALKRPKIIHFTAKIKPWHFIDASPYRKKYYYYLSKTPWKDFRPKADGIKSIIIKFVLLVTPRTFYKYLRVMKKKL